MTSSKPATARGSAVQATVAFIEERFGATVLERVLGQLGRAERQQLLETGLKDHVPYDKVVHFWTVADRILAPIDANWMEAAGAFSIGSLGRKLYGGLLLKASPLEFLTQSVSLFKLFYSEGDVILVEMMRGRAVVRLVGFEEHGAFFCRRQIGGLRSAAEIAGGVDVSVRHVRCTVEGDAFCEWEMRWR